MEYPANVPFPARTAWPGVELRHLVALQAVLAAGSFNGAAARLGYTQSAVSAQIRSLERLTGVRVIDRSRGARSIAATREGAILLRYATEIVGTFEAAASHLVRDVPAPDELRVGTFRSASLALAAPALARLPDLAVSLVEVADEETVFDLLAAGDLDVAFAVAPVHPRYVSAILRDEGHVVVVAPDDPLAARDVVALSDLAGRRVVVDSTRHGSLLAQAALAHHAVGATVLDDSTLVTALGAAGAGVALLPELAHGGGGIAVPIRVGIPRRTIVLAWHEDRPLSLLAKRFLQAVAAASASASAAAA